MKEQAEKESISAEFCDIHDQGNESPKWTNIDFLITHLVPEVAGGGIPFRRRFKTAFIVHNRSTIIAAAHANGIPAELLAGIAFVEVAGKVPSWKGELFNHRSFRDMFYSGGKKADRTSFGFMSIQIRAAAETLGLDPATLGPEKQIQLAHCLEQDVYSVNMAARHLRMLADHDHFEKIGEDEVKIIAARYNQGTTRTIEQIRKDLSYGNLIVRNWHSLTLMLAGAPVK